MKGSMIIQIHALFLVAMIMNILVVTASERSNGIVWSRGADIPLPRGGYFAEWYNGGLWLAGGSYWKDGKKLWTNEVSFYDPKTATWSTSSPIPKAFGYGVTAKVGRDIYLLGGTDGEGDLNRDIYRLRDGNWTKIGDAPVGVVYPAYSVMGSKVYIFGGSSSPNDVTRATNETWIYDTSANTWKKGPSIPGQPRQIFSAAAVRGRIYVFGGVTQKPGEKFHNLDDAYRLDPEKGKWKRLSNLPRAMRAFWAGTDGKNVYLFGGYEEGGLDTVYRYSTSADSYESVSRLPQPLMDTKFIFNKGIFYGASGEDKLVSRFPGMVIGRIRK
jgi:N-acetylneuraminic acid mutarotase